MTPLLTGFKHFLTPQIRSFSTKHPGICTPGKLWNYTQGLRCTSRLGDAKMKCPNVSSAAERAINNVKDNLFNHGVAEGMSTFMNADRFCDCTKYVSDILETHGWTLDKSQDAEDDVVNTLHLNAELGTALFLKLTVEQQAKLRASIKHGSE